MKRIWKRMKFRKVGVGFFLMRQRIKEYGYAEYSDYYSAAHRVDYRIFGITVRTKFRHIRDVGTHEVLKRNIFGTTIHIYEV